MPPWGKQTANQIILYLQLFGWWTPILMSMWVLCSFIYLFIYSYSFILFPDGNLFCIFAHVHDITAGKIMSWTDLLTNEIWVSELYVQWIIVVCPVLSFFFFWRHWTWSWELNWLHGINKVSWTELNICTLHTVFCCHGHSLVIWRCL